MRANAPAASRQHGFLVLQPWAVPPPTQGRHPVILGPPLPPLGCATPGVQGRRARALQGSQQRGSGRSRAVLHVSEADFEDTLFI